MALALVVFKRKPLTVRASRGPRTHLEGSVKGLRHPNAETNNFLVPDECAEDGVLLLFTQSILNHTANVTCYMVVCVTLDADSAK